MDTGLRVARGYQSTWLSSTDMRAGLSLAAVAVPTGIAYAQLVGVPPVVGLYASHTPAGCVRLFRLISTTDCWPGLGDLRDDGRDGRSAGGGYPERYASLTVILTLLVGLICIVAGISILAVGGCFKSSLLRLSFEVLPNPTNCRWWDW